MRTLVAGLAVLAAGCATMQPGQGVDEGFARSWGCSYEQVMERAEELEERLPEGRMWTPQVGWDACELMARNGKPDDTDRTYTNYSTTATWWWQTDDGLKMVSMELVKGGEWEVTYVDM